MPRILPRHRRKKSDIASRKTPHAQRTLFNLFGLRKEAQHLKLNGSKCPFRDVSCCNPATDGCRPGCVINSSRSLHPRQLRHGVLCCVSHLLKMDLGRPLGSTATRPINVPRFYFCITWRSVSRLHSQAWAEISTRILNSRTSCKPRIHTLTFENSDS